MTAQEFGALLRERREAKGFTVEELAGRIKLSVRTLRGIEDGSMDGLPHAVYARGFVRSYAQQVGLGQEEIAEGLDILFPIPSGKDEHPLPGPIDRHRSSGGRRFGDKFIAALIVLVLLVLPVGAGWFVFTRYGDTIVEWVKQPFIATSTEARHEGVNPGDIAANAANTENSVPVTGDTPSVTPGAVAGAAVGTPAAPEGTGGTAPAPAEGEAAVNTASAPAANGAAEPASSAPAAEPAAAPAAPVSESNASAGAVQPPHSGEHTLQIFAEQSCWVKVRADNASTRSFELKKGETSFLPFKKGLELTLGNAGGVKLRYNGSSFDAKAKPGEVKSFTFPPR